MKRTTIIGLFGLFVLAGGVVGASAQSVGGALYVTYGTTRFAARESFEAVTEASSKTGIGIGGTVTGLWRGVFVDAGFSQQKVLGQRVFVDQGTVYSLGIPVRITLRPVDVAAGWRLQAGRVSPYVGAGLAYLSYKEESDFSVSGDDVDERKTGPLVLLGVDVRLVRLLKIGGELRYRAIQGVLGVGGASQAFGEDQAGGMAFAARVSVGS